MKSTHLYERSSVYGIWYELTRYSVYLPFILAHLSLSQAATFAFNYEFRIRQTPLSLVIDGYPQEVGELFSVCAQLLGVAMSNHVDPLLIVEHQVQLTARAIG
jgi:hypothetical protein